jgi:hypothetical protein
LGCENGLRGQGNPLHPNTPDFFYAIEFIQLLHENSNLEERLQYAYRFILELAKRGSSFIIVSKA